MPTILRAGEFRLLIYLPPREHAPPHVHVWNADGEAGITLAAEGRPQQVRTVAGMRASDVAAAFWLVEAHTPYLLQRWREYHG